jgi:hypothetical protein
MKKIISALVTLTICSVSVHAKLGMSLVKNENKIGKWYFNALVDANTLSWAFINGNGASNFRFNNFVNTGLHATVNLKSKLAFYTGLEFRNMGFANRVVNLKYRHSTTYIGLPLGLRIGDLKSKTEFIGGTGFDVPTYYKYKSWNVGDKKNKFKTTKSSNGILRSFNPYLFVGYKMKGLGIKLQYYPQTFFVNSLSPKTHLMYASLILDMAKGNKLPKKKVVPSE